MTPFLASMIVLFIDLVGLGFLLFLLWELIRLGSVPPFVPTRTPITEEIARIVGTLPEGSVVYDPGCGDARVLHAIAKQNPHVRYVGIEMRRFPYLLASHKRKQLPGIDISFIRGNSFKQDLSSATHVYAYMYGSVMDAMLPKLKQELTPGALVYSLDFPFSHKEPEQVILLASAQKRKLGKTLYVYRF